MKLRIDRSEVRDSVVIVICVSTLALVFVVLWKLGTPIVLLVVALITTCLLACFAFIHTERKSKGENKNLFNKGKEEQWRA
ncbi:MAG: hypothetical protein ACE5QW_06395 [Thermoplasmata archaeon]